MKKRPLAKPENHHHPVSLPLGGRARASSNMGSNTVPHIAYHDLPRWIKEARNAAPRMGKRCALGFTSPSGVPYKPMARGSAARARGERMPVE